MMKENSKSKAQQKLKANYKPELTKNNCVALVIKNILGQRGYCFAKP